MFGVGCVYVYVWGMCGVYVWGMCVWGMGYGVCVECMCGVYVWSVCVECMCGGLPTVLGVACHMRAWATPFGSSRVLSFCHERGIEAFG